MVTIKGRAASLLVVLIVGLSFSVVSATNALAADCGAVLATGSNWAGGHGVDVKSNGPFQSTGDSCGGYMQNSAQTPGPNSVSITTGYKWQCVELVNRFYVVHGWISSRWTGNGGEMFDTAPTGLTKQTNGQITNVRIGAVYILQGHTFGHVGVVSAVSDNGNGTKTIQIANQNTEGVFYNATWNVANKTITSIFSGYTFKGLVHHPDNNLSTPPSAPPPPPDTDSDGVIDDVDWCLKVSGFSTNRGCPNNITQVSGDVDGDGRDDVVAISRGNDNHPTISWLRSNGTSLDPPQMLLEMPAPAWNVLNLKFATGDFNGDGKDDLFAASGSAANPPNLYVFLSTGTTFASPTLVKQPNPAYWLWERLEFFAADIDGDNRDDVVAVSRGLDDGPGIHWFRSTSVGSGPSLTDSASLVSLHPAAWKVPTMKFAFGDFNGDNRDDMFVASGSGSSGVNAYIFASMGTELGGPVLQYSLSAAAWQFDRLQWLASDLDGDSKIDVVAVSRSFADGPDINWFRSNGSSLAQPVHIKSLNPAAWKVSNLKWAVTDTNGDGKDDLFAASGNQSNPVSIYLLMANSGLGDPVQQMPLNPISWIWERIQW